MSIKVNKEDTGEVYKAVLRISKLWALTEPQMASILGVDIEQLTSWRVSISSIFSLSANIQYRLGHLLGIYESLQTLFPEPTIAGEWLKRPNTDAPFGGKSPLDILLQGGDQGLVSVDQYLKSWVHN